MRTLKPPVKGRSKSAFLILLLLSILASPVSGRSLSTASSGDGRSDSVTGSLNEVHSASDLHRKLGWWYNFWMKHSRPKETSSPTNSPTPNPTKPPTELPTKAPTELPTKAPTELPTKAPTIAPTPVTTTSNSPTSCEVSPEEIFDVDFELVLEASDNNITNVTSEEVVKIEGTTLQFLRDNIGGECTFSVQSLVVVGNESATSASVKGRYATAAATVFSINATVSMKTSFIASLQEGLSDVESNGSRRLDDVCTSKDKLKCCINWAINQDKAKKCKKKGCTDDDCARKDVNNTAASLFDTNENSYYGADFTNLMNQIVQVDSAKSALDVTASVLATCSVAHEAIVVIREFGDFISREDPNFYALVQPILNEFVVENCRNYTSLDCQEIDDIFCDGSNSESSYCELPCDNVILPPTSTPTLKPTPKPTTFSTPKPTILQNPLKYATYDDSFNAPRCFTVGRGCDSGASLLNSRGNMSPAEPHASNTIDNCKDGDAGTYHVDESIDRVTITSTDGGLLTEATEALIEASVWAYSTAADFADFFYAADAASPDWQFIKTVKPTITASLNTLSANYTLPMGRNQAVRVIFRFGGVDEKNCPEGPYDDVDDLVFAVVTGSPTVSPSPTLSPTITISPTTSVNPSSIITEIPTLESPTGLPTLSPTLLPTFTIPPTASAHPTPFTFTPTLLPTNFPTTYEPTTTTEQPTFSFAPSTSPTLSMFPTASSRAPVIEATYNTTYKAPKCAMIGSGCEATASLLKSRGNLDPPEPNASNTIDGCEDGNGGVYLEDESVESISVTSINGGPLVVGTEVRIDATVWAWETAVDTVDFWHAPLDDLIPSWSLIESVNPTKSLSLNAVSTRFFLEDEGDNAVRVVMRYSGYPMACPGGDFDDVDDLVFVVGSGGGNGVLAATYDDTLKAPKCSSVTRACYAGPSLLKSRGTVGPGEPNAPNTIDQCEDGSEGEYLVDESIESIRVTSTDGGDLVEGANVRVEAKVWVYGYGDYADFWYAADANLPEWKFAETVNMTVDMEFDTVSTEYYLPEGNLQAVRVVFRFGNNATDPCPGDLYDDVDDLVFVVGSA